MSSEKAGSAEGGVTELTGVYVHRWRHKPRPGHINVLASHQPKPGDKSVGWECQACTWRGVGDAFTPYKHAKRAHDKSMPCHVYYDPLDDQQINALRKARDRENSRQYRKRKREQAAAEVSWSMTNKGLWSWHLACQASLRSVAFVVGV